MPSSSITRITGMATGMDTDSIVKKMMDVEKIPLNKLKQKQQTELWLSDAYRQWNKDLLAFQSNTLFNMKLSSAYNTFDVSSTQVSAVSGTATSSAISGSYSVTVKQVAESATMTGKVQFDPSKTLGDTNQGINQLESDISLTLNVTNDPKDSTAVQTVQNFVIKQTDTINDVVARLNDAKDDTTGKSLGLQAMYDPTLKQIIVKTKATGETTNISFTNPTYTSTTATPSVAASDYITNILGFGTLTDNGLNAEIDFNGTTVSTPTNNVNIMGISLTVKSPTSKDASGNYTSSTIVVSQNVDTEVKNIKDYIDKYNELLDKIYKANDEPVYKDYLPLTDDQRNDLSEKQIEQWEEKAKSGLLRRDSILTDVMNRLRSAMGSVISNGSNYNSLASIGISSKSYQDQGKLYVDEKKLREAIQTDPDAVRNLFSQIGGTKTGTNGLVQQVSDVVTQGIKDLTKKAGTSGSSQYDQSIIGRLLANLQKDITRQNSRMVDKENQYYKQFAAMEAAVNKFNSQGSWLSSQMSGGQ